MSITVKDVEYVARLARLALSEEEKQSFTAHLTNILSHFEKLKELNTDQVLPTSHPFFSKTVWRQDAHQPGQWTESILRNAPEKEDAYFKVKKVIE